MFDDGVASRRGRGARSPKAVEQTRRVEGVAAGPHAVEQTLRGRRKNTGAKRQMSKNGGRGTGFTGKSLQNVVSARGGCARGARAALEPRAAAARRATPRRRGSAPASLLSGSVVAARAEAKLRSKNKNASTRDRGVGARGNFYQVTVGLRQNCGAPRGVRTGGHGLAINWFLSTDLENTRRILDAHEEVCVCFGRVAVVPAQLQTAGYYPSSSFIFTRVVSRRARAV